MCDLRTAIRSQLTLAGSKLAAERMYTLVSSVELSIMSILFTLGEVNKEIIFKLIDRDQTTISHSATNLRAKGYIHETRIHCKKYRVKLTTAGVAVYTQYICASARKSAELENHMPKTHIEKTAETGENPPNG